MEYLIILVIILAYSSLSEKINTISKKLSVDSSKNQKKFSPLKDLVGSNIKIDTDDLLYIMDWSKEGILKSFDDTWILLEHTYKYNRKETYYYRISNIKSISIINEN